MRNNRFNEIGFLSPSPAWKDHVRDLHRPSFELCDRINRLGMQILFASPAEKIDYARLLATAGLGRAMQSFQCAILLCELGALAEGRAAVRSCCETAIGVAALKTDPNATVALLEADHLKARESMANVTLEKGKNDLTTIDIDRLKALRDSIREVAGDRSMKSVTWANVASNPVVQRDQLYDLVYRTTSSDAVHFTLDSLTRFITENQAREPTGFKFHPDDSDLADTLFYAQLSILHVLETCTSWFDLPRYSIAVIECLKEMQRLQEHP